MEEKFKEYFDSLIFLKKGCLNNVSEAIGKGIVGWKKIPDILKDPFYSKFVNWQLILPFIKFELLELDEIKNNIPDEELFIYFSTNGHYTKAKEVLDRDNIPMSIVEFILFKNQKIYELVKFSPIILDFEIETQIKLFVLYSDMENLCNLFDKHFNKIFNEAHKQKKYNLLSLICNFKPTHKIELNIACEFIENNCIIPPNQILFDETKDSITKLVNSCFKSKYILLLKFMDDHQMLYKEHMISIQKNYPNFQFKTNLLECPFNEETTKYELNENILPKILDAYKTEFYDLLCKKPNVFNFIYFITKLDMNILLKSENYKLFFIQFILDLFYSCKLLKLDHLNIESLFIIFNSTECLSIIYNKYGKSSLISEWVKYYEMEMSDNYRKVSLSIFMKFCLEKNIIIPKDIMEKLM